jgi:hypothetical protein
MISLSFYRLILISSPFTKHYAALEQRIGNFTTLRFAQLSPVSIGAAKAFVIPATPATRASPHRGAGRAGWRSERIRTAASAQRQRSFLVCHRVVNVRAPVVSSALVAFAFNQAKANWDSVVSSVDRAGPRTVNVVSARVFSSGYSPRPMRAGE